MAIKSAVEKSKLPVDCISDLCMGNVLSAGVGQAPARQASILAGLPVNIEAITVNKVCASGLKAVVLAAQNIQLGLAEATIAGGMECMSRAPYYSPRGTHMPSTGSVTLEDGLIRDGLSDAYSNLSMGICAEKTAKEYRITREAQDKYAAQSYTRSWKAWTSFDGRFAFSDEIVAVTVAGRKGSVVVDTDEGYRKQDLHILNQRLNKLSVLKPAFIQDGTGTITAGNASSLNDGASALVLCNGPIARKYSHGSRVLSRIVGMADAGVNPVDFSIAPANAIRTALSRAGISKEQVAVWELNEAFAVVILANVAILGIDPNRINPLGGAISLGHALGSSGSRILVTLVHQLSPGQYGVAAVCNGGGGATALVVQRIDLVRENSIL